MAKLLQSLALAGITGVAGVTAMLSAPSAQAAVLFDGTLGDWVQAGELIAGDKKFTFGDTDLNFGDTLIIETAGIDDLDYLVNVNLIGTGTTVSSFFLDYTVEVINPAFRIVAVDLDSTVDVFAPDEVLTTTYNGTTLVSTAGSPELDFLVPPSTFVEVSNSYFAPPGGEISAFENSFKQAEIPEPLTILGTTMALGIGTMFKKRRSSAN